MQWADQIGRRIKLRDLRVLLAVAEARSISHAAEFLAISHPVVSRTISELERTLGVRLFDRSSQGVRLTIYGKALLDCGVAVFDDLRSGVQRLECLSDPASVRQSSFRSSSAEQQQGDTPRCRALSYSRQRWARSLQGTSLYPAVAPMPVRTPPPES
jgi:DNA-binding transcriptional LysR family regulator